MATQTVTYKIDDLTGEQESPQSLAETVEFALDGVTYEIDLLATNAANLRDALSQFVAAGRKAGRSSTATRTASASSQVKTDREQTRAIRAWARSRGASVSERGRIPAEIAECYRRGGDAAEQAIRDYVANQQASDGAQAAPAANGQPAPALEFTGA